GNTPDSGSGESWFDPRRGNSKRDITMSGVALRPFWTLFPGWSGEFCSRDRSNSRRHMMFRRLTSWRPMRTTPAFKRAIPGIPRRARARRRSAGTATEPLGEPDGGGPRPGHKWPPEGTDDRSDEREGKAGRCASALPVAAPQRADLPAVCVRELVMDQNVFAELLESANEALAHAKGKRELRTTELPPPPRPVDGGGIKRLRTHLKMS